MWPSCACVRGASHLSSCGSDNNKQLSHWSALLKLNSLSTLLVPVCDSSVAFQFLRESETFIRRNPDWLIAYGTQRRNSAYIRFIQNPHLELNRPLLFPFFRSTTPRPFLNSFLLPSWRAVRSYRPHLEERDSIWGVSGRKAPSLDGLLVEVFCGFPRL